MTFTKVAVLFLLAVAVTEARAPWTTTMAMMIPRGGSSDFSVQLEGVKSSVLETASSAVSNMT
jgi:hypothetical protein